jgi:hypothetical protein
MRASRPAYDEGHLLQMKIGAHLAVTTRTTAAGTEGVGR